MGLQKPTAEGDAGVDGSYDGDSSAATGPVEQRKYKKKADVEICLLFCV